MRVIRVAVFTLFFVSIPAVADDSARKEAKVRQLLELTGAKELGDQVVGAMLDQVKANPDLPAGFGEKFKELAQKDSIVDRLVPVYKAHLEEQDLDAAIVFYRSKAGQNWVRAQSAISLESIRIGQDWGTSVGRQTIDALGPRPDASPKPR